jgi:hypothetical protein
MADAFTALFILSFLSGAVALGGLLFRHHRHWAKWVAPVSAVIVVIAGIGIGATSEDRRAKLAREAEQAAVMELAAAEKRKLAEERSAQAARIAAERAEQEKRLAELRGQAGFLRAVEQSRAVYERAANDMAKGAARIERRQLICAALRSLRVTDWEGTVYSLSSNSDGMGVIELAIGPGIYVKTWNNALSDIGYGTLIHSNSAVFKSAASLKKGDHVVFSGDLISHQTDCVLEPSLTMDGSMREPEFIFRFSAISGRPGE